MKFALKAPVAQIRGYSKTGPDPLSQIRTQFLSLLFVFLNKIWKCHLKKLAFSSVLEPEPEPQLFAVVESIPVPEPDLDPDF